MWGGVPTEVGSETLPCGRAVTLEVEEMENVGLATREAGSSGPVSGEVHAERSSENKQGGVVT